MLAQFFVSLLELNVELDSTTAPTKNKINIWLKLPITVWQLQPLQLKIGGRHIRFKPQIKCLNFGQQVEVVGSGRFRSFLCCSASVSVKDLRHKNEKGEKEPIIQL